MSENIWCLWFDPSVLCKCSTWLVHTDRIKCSKIGQFLLMRKTWSVRKFCILLRKCMCFIQVWMSLKYNTYLRHLDRIRHQMLSNVFKCYQMLSNVTKCYQMFLQFDFYIFHDSLFLYLIIDKQTIL